MAPREGAGTQRRSVPGHKRTFRNAARFRDDFVRRILVGRMLRHLHPTVPDHPLRCAHISELLGLSVTFRGRKGCIEQRSVS